MERQPAGVRDRKRLMPAVFFGGSEREQGDRPGSLPLFEVVEGSEQHSFQNNGFKKFNELNRTLAKILGSGHWWRRARPLSTAG
jgi:hypothetical protein